MEFRRRNVLGNKDLGSTGQIFEGDVLKPMLDRMSELRAAKPSKRNLAGERLYGREHRPSAPGSYLLDHPQQPFNLNADGSATLVTAGVEIGSGSMMQSLPRSSPVRSVFGLKMSSSAPPIRTQRVTMSASAVAEQRCRWERPAWPRAAKCAKSSLMSPRTCWKPPGRSCFEERQSRGRRR